MRPVAIGAAIPIALTAKFMMPPTAPTPPFGATRDGSDQPTGAAAARPAREMEIQKIAHAGLAVIVAPTTAKPSSIPATRTVLRTRVSSAPRAIRASSSHPPPARSVRVATAQGVAVEDADLRMLMPLVLTR